MSWVLPPSINLIEYSGRPWSDIKFIEKEGDSSGKSSSSPKECKATRLLPRSDYPLFGQFPKLDTRVLLECAKCGKVLLPSVFNAHCNNPEHESLAAVVAPPAAPVKATNRNRKASTKPPAACSSPAGPSSLATGSGSVTLTVSKAPLPLPPPTPVAAVAAASTTSATAAAVVVGGPSRPSKHKKSSKSTKRSRKEEASSSAPPDVVHPAKISKHDVEHLVAVATASTEMLVDSELPELLADESIATSSLKLPPRVEEQHSNHHLISLASQLHAQVDDEPMEQEEEEQVAVPMAVADEVISVSNDVEEEDEEENQEDSPVDHLPMSPVAVVNIVPVQYLQQYLHLPTQPIVVTIPCTSPSTHMYSYPKPLAVSTRAIRKIGNTYLLQSQRLDHQRAEIQAITRSRRAYSNASALNHLPT